MFLAHLTLLNDSSTEILEEQPMMLVCKYGGYLPKGEHIHWSLNNHRIKPDNQSNFSITYKHLISTNETITKLKLSRFSTKKHQGFYSCQYKGLTKSVRISGPIQYKFVPSSSTTTRYWLQIIFFNLILIQYCFII